MFSAAAVGMLGSVGLAVDTGRLLGTKAEMQKTADAAALAGAQELPNGWQAVQMAHEYTHKNADELSSHEFDVESEDGVNDHITVTVSKRVDYTFLRVLGLSGSTVSAEATVRRGYYNGGTGIVPFGFIASNDPTSTLLQNDCYDDEVDGLPTFYQGVDCTLKYGAGTNSGGDFGAMALDGPGAQEYEDAIRDGSNSPITVGQTLNPQTGAMVGPTRQSIRDRLARPAPVGCPGNDIDDVLSENDGTWTIVSGCALSPRLIIVPVVDRIENPFTSEVLGFAVLFLTGETMQGGQLQIQGQFVTLASPLVGGQYDNPDAVGSTAISLSQ